MDRMNQNKNIGTTESTAELLRRLDALLGEDWKVEAVLAEVEETVQQPEPTVSREGQVGKKPNSRLRDWMVLFHDLVYILAAILIAFTFFIRMSRVEGSSMKPTLVNHDRMLLLSSIWYSSPERGDIVVARIPAFSEDPIVKRVIAVEGDTVNIDFESGSVYVNGELQTEDYINELTHRDFAENGIEFPVTIEKNHVFLMGDNRNDSYDSRYAAIGQVDRRCILGKAFFLFYPGKDPDVNQRDYSRFGFVK